MILESVNIINLKPTKMKKGFILATIVAAMSIIGYVESAQSKTDTSMIQLTDMEAISTCELPDGYKANGHCVSNDRYQYFCSNVSGSRDCVQ